MSSNSSLPTVSKLSVFVAVVTRSAPRLIEASLIPSALFYCCLVLIGIGAAYAAAVFWLYARGGNPLGPPSARPAPARPRRHRHHDPDDVAVASGSTFVYFAQPVLGSLVVGCVFLVPPLRSGRPMVEALALDFWPLTPDMRAHPAVVRLLRRLTFLWAGINLAIGATTFTLLVVLPLPAFVAVKQSPPGRSPPPASPSRSTGQCAPRGEQVSPPKHRSCATRSFVTRARPRVRVRRLIGEARRGRAAQGSRR